MEKLDQIKELIAAGETEKALEMLVAFTKQNKSDQESEALLLLGQFRQWKRENMLGVQQSNSELRRIEMGIMDLLDDDKFAANTVANTPTRPAPMATTAPSTAPSKFPMKPVLIGLGGLLLVIILVMTMGGDDGGDLEPATNTETQEAVGEDAAATDPNNATETTPVSSINGRNLGFVAFGNTETQGYFEKTEGSIWVEMGLDNQTKFEYTEQTRDEWSVYLLDNKRPVKIQLDLYKKQVVYTAQGNEPVVIGNILDATK